MAAGEQGSTPRPSRAWNMTGVPASGTFFDKLICSFVSNYHASSVVADNSVIVYRIRTPVWHAWNMAAGEQGSTPRLVMLETSPRKTCANFFCPIYCTSTVNMQQRSIAYSFSQYYNGDNLGLFFLHAIIRTCLHHSRSQGKLSGN